MRKGRVETVETPAPKVSAGSVLIRTRFSCVSAGTELAGLASSGKSILRKALEKPEKAARVLETARREGLARTVAATRLALDAADAPGYSLAGTVAAVGAGVDDFASGDLVAAAGSGLAVHAEYVDVPRNLVMRVPAGLSLADASTAALGGVAMQAVRRAEPALGEFVLVAGTGLLGLLITQLLAASGARVLATDPDRGRLDLALSLGAEAVFHPGEGDAGVALLHYTGGHGADAAVFAAATSDPEALSGVFRMTRKKGRVVMAGVYGDVLRREDIYAKEIDFRISCSYGPGRYDEAYEKRGLDYPYAYARWTENRNMAEYLRLAAAGRVRPAALNPAVFPVERADEAYRALAKNGPDRPLLILLDYGEPETAEISRAVRSGPVEKRVPGEIRVGLIGAGDFALNAHLQNIKAMPGRFRVRAVCARSGASNHNALRASGARYAASDHLEILDDPEIDLAMICARHDLHGPMVLDALSRGKHAFVEKPLCVAREELEAIEAFYREREGGPVPLLMPGFNRRFSPLVREMARLAAGRINPLFMSYAVHAGYLPPDHWTHGPEGGGRMVGEACHMLDLFSFLADAPVRAFSAASLRPASESVLASDNKAVALEYADGSVAQLNYMAVAAPGLPKERLEVHFDGKSLILSDFRELAGYGVKPGLRKSAVPAKGHKEELEALWRSLAKGEAWPVPLESMLETTAVSLELA